MDPIADPEAPIAVDDALRDQWSEANPATRVDFELARAEVATWQAHRAAAQQIAAITEVLAEARRHPEIFVTIHAEPTARELQIAIDAAIADLAVRLSMSEPTVAALARQGETLRARAPRLWAMFREGEISTANARTVASVLETLPQHRATDEQFEGRALELAALVPARFRERMRALRERLHPVAASERHADAMTRRRLALDHEQDGMAWLGVQLAATDAETAWQRVDGIARQIADAPDESRTLDQLRADVVADLLTGRTEHATAPRVTVGVLVPVLTLLGVSDEPGTLDGRVPIDADTARRLAAGATSFHRILTHPVSSTVLDVDRTSYRPPADLTRWLAVRDGTCRFPGCGRSAKNCDIDHTVDWAAGGTTSARNLGHLSRRHHTLKHESRWRVEQGPDEVITWTSPTGFRRTADPPPF